jgi:hypothetical protein
MSKPPVIERSLPASILARRTGVGARGKVFVPRAIGQASYAPAIRLARCRQECAGYRRSVVAPGWRTPDRR